MAKQYSEVFKRNCVQKLTDLKAEGIIRINKVEVKNVRELVKTLDISNDSLYKWNKVYFCAKSNDNDVSDDFFDDENIEVSKKSTGELKQIKKDAITEFATNLRNLSALAQALQIPNYSRMVLAQLKLSIGNELIKQSGLIDMNKVSKDVNRKINGEGL